MKRSIPILCAGAIVLATSLLFAPVARAGLTEAVQAFDQGNRHYAVGNYEAAVQAYEQAISEGYVSAALFHNLGNAYYRQDELGEAVLSYERARRISPGDSQVLHNIALTRERTVDRFTRLPVPYWQQAWRFVVRHVGAWGLFALGIVFWFVAAATLIRRILHGSNAPWLRRTMAASLLSGVVFLGSAYAASFDRQLGRQGVVVSDRVDLRTAPSDSSALELEVHEGVMVDLLEARSDWALVRLPNGVRGWASMGAIREINL